MNSYEKLIPKMSNTLPPAILLMGPTASGKTQIAVELAQSLGCEIISVDSAMVYRGMDIGTAKPTIAERGGIPHHLIDILDPAEASSTGQFCARASSLMSEITARGKIPLLVGGTMLYFYALLNGLAELPAADPDIRRQIDDEAQHHDWKYMHNRLSVIDPATANRIHPNDSQRIQRALEVFRISGKTLTELCKPPHPKPLPFSTIKLIIEPKQRKQLHARIERRFIQMIESGLVSEVQKLHKRGDLHTKLPAIRTVGYRQVWGYFEGHYDMGTMIDKAFVATRQLAKRQLTWLRRDQSGHRFYFEDLKITQTILAKLVSLLDLERIL